MDHRNDNVLVALRQASGDEHLTIRTGPRPLDARNTVLFVELETDQPRLTDPAVIRMCDKRTNAVREAIVGEYLNRSGFPTPSVLLTGSPGDVLGGAWLLIQMAPGPERTTGFRDGVVSAIRSIRSFFERPDMVAGVIAQLHRIDPDPVRAELEQTNSEFDWRQFLWDRATNVPAEGADKVVEWLTDNEPPASPSALSHGDLHFDNIIFGSTEPQIIDWGIGCLAPPARDVACTMFALMTTGSQHATKLTEPLLWWLGGTFASRFLRRYRQLAHEAFTTEELDWHRVLYSMNRLFWAYREVNEGSCSSSPATGGLHEAERLLVREFSMHARIIDEIAGIKIVGPGR